MRAMEMLESRAMLSAAAGATDILATRVVNTSGFWAVNLNGGSYYVGVQVQEYRQMHVNVSGHVVSGGPTQKLLIVQLDAVDNGPEGSLEGGLFSVAGSWEATDFTFTRDGLGGAHLKADHLLNGVDVGTGEIVSMDLDLTWKAKGPTSVQRFSGRDVFDDVTLLTFASVQSRNSVLTGKVIGTQTNGSRPGRVLDLSPKFAAAATPVQAMIQDARELDITLTAVPRGGVFSLEAIAKREEVWA